MAMTKRNSLKKYRLPSHKQSKLRIRLLYAPNPNQSILDKLSGWMWKILKMLQ